VNIREALSNYHLIYITNKFFFFILILSIIININIIKKNR